jgi:release factor glutamine methyltransferase
LFAMSIQETLREALSRATAQLATSPQLRADAHRDALVLLLHTTGISRAALHADPDRTLTTEEQSHYEALIQRRLTSEPIQYITGEQEFYGLALRVTPAVLIPRPETEHLVESVLSELDPAASHSILDIGTGSGAIAIALAFHLPYARVTAVDISPAALEVAVSNAARHNLSHRIRFAEADLLNFLEVDILSEAKSHFPTNSGTVILSEAKPHFPTNLESVILSEAKSHFSLNSGSVILSEGSRVPARAEVEGPAVVTEQFDVIVSNPPYVPTSDRDSLHPQVRDHEPASALFAGPSGLDIYRRLIPQAHAALTSHGLLALEIGHNQRDSIAALLSGWNAVRFVDDLQHIPRVALARKP